MVAPLSSPTADPTTAIGAATGRYLSDVLRPGMRIGVGWGKTLISALDYIEEKPLPGLSVVSMLGGIAKVLQYNPADFAWQFSRLLQADCFLIPAPALVDSIETKQALIERCGLAEIFELGRALDLVVMSTGGMAPDSTSYRVGYFSEADRRSLIAAGAVGDLLYTFFDIDGRIIDHPIYSRVMGIPSDSIAAAPHRILTSGGIGKVDAIVGAIRLSRPTVLITDEITAAAALAAVGVSPGGTGPSGGPGPSGWPASSDAHRSSGSSSRRKASSLRSRPFSRDSTTAMKHKRRPPTTAVTSMPNCASLGAFLVNTMPKVTIRTPHTAARIVMLDLPPWAQAGVATGRPSAMARPNSTSRARSRRIITSARSGFAARLLA